MSYQFFDVLACGFEVLSGVEVIRVLNKMLADGCGANKAEVGVDVDFANRHFCSLCKQLFRNADGIGHLTAEFVDNLYPLLRNGGCTVQNYREAGQAFFNFFENVEAEHGLVAWLELVCTVAGSDGNGKGVNAGALNKFFDLVGSGVRGILGADVYVILNSCKSAKLTLNADVVSMSILHNLSGQCDVILEIIF